MKFALYSIKAKIKGYCVDVERRAISEKVIRIADIVLYCEVSNIIHPVTGEVLDEVRVREV